MSGRVSSIAPWPGDEPLCGQARRRSINRQLVLISCHADVLEWLNPDWVIDCNTRRVMTGGALA